MKGNKITRDECLKLMEDTKRRNQVNGLVFHHSQVPTKKNNNGWDYIISPPTKKKRKTESCIRIAIANSGFIFVQYLGNDSPPTSVTDGVDHFLTSHTEVRTQDGERGKMCPLGVSVDDRGSCMSMYKATKLKGANAINEKQILKNSALWLNDTIIESFCVQEYQLEMEKLKKKRNVLTFHEGDKKRFVLPTMVVSEDLTNSVHNDVNDDCKSFSIFFQKKGSDGKTWFILPELGVIIEISSTVILCWDGRKVKHCSLTVKNGILSLFGSSSKKVSRKKEVELLGFEIEHNTNLCVGNSVFVRERLNDMVKYDPGLNLNGLNGNAFMTRLATVQHISPCGKLVTVGYKAKLSRLGQVVVKSDHVCLEGSTKK